MLHADSHVDFLTTPIAGLNLDNIYTQWAGNGLFQPGFKPNLYTFTGGQR